MLGLVLYSSFSLCLLCNLARSLIKTPDKVERSRETENRSRNCQVAMTKPWRKRKRRRRKSQTMKTFACCSLAGFPSYDFGVLSVFSVFPNQTHSLLSSLVLSFFPSLSTLSVGQSFVGNSFESRGIVKELKGFPSGFGWVATGAGIEVGAECLTRRPLKSCSSSGLMQKYAGGGECKKYVKPQTRWPIFNSHAPGGAVLEHCTTKTFLCVYFVYNF